MNATEITDFLRELSRNNNREWFDSNRSRYKQIRQRFEQSVAEFVEALAKLDPTIAHITPKDATYRINRDTRFSPDKSPYKTFMGAYIAAHGKKAFHGGYYLNIEPGNCFVSVGNYYLPTNILTAVRNEMIACEQEWRDCVESPKFLRLFANKGPVSNTLNVDQTQLRPQGFGITHLKKCPAGFPADHPLVEYLRMKDYCAWHRLETADWEAPDWRDRIIKVVKAGKPMLDFTNRVIDDYE